MSIGVFENAIALSCRSFINIFSGSLSGVWSVKSVSFSKRSTRSTIDSVKLDANSGTFPALNNAPILLIVFLIFRRAGEGGGNRVLGAAGGGNHVLGAAGGVNRVIGAAPGTSGRGPVLLVYPIVLLYLN